MNLEFTYRYYKWVNLREKSEESNIHFMPDDGVFAPGSADLLACQAGSWTNAESNN